MYIILDRYHGNESLNSAVSAVTNTLAGSVETPKVERFQKVFSIQSAKESLRGWLTKI
jgi:hypothetical protein